jgi:hypothetical protein
MNWINLYFSRHLPRTLIHFLYLLQCLLLTAKLLAHFGILYAYPGKIDAAEVFAFFLKGQSTIPIWSYLTICLFFNQMNKGINIAFFRGTRGKIPFMRSLKEKVVTLASSRLWFEKEGDSYRKLPNHNQFATILDSFDADPANLIALAQLFNSALVAALLCLILYPEGGIFRKYLLVAGTVFYLTHLFNLIFLRTVHADIEFYRSIRRQIDRKNRKLWRRPSGA